MTKKLKSLILDDETNKYVVQGSKIYANLTQRNRVSETAFVRHIIMVFMKKFGTDIKKSME